MTLHFNLKNIFLGCLILAICQVCIGHTFFLGTGIILFYDAVLWKKKSLSQADIVLSAAILMNVWYVSSSWGNVRQHDYFNFVMFADYFVKNHFFIMPPVSYLQSVYYHPPVWGLISGLFMYFLEFDTVRFMSFFAVIGAYILMWHFMTKLKIKENIQLWLFMFYCFYPVHGIMSNWVNNDAFVYFLMIALIYITFLWYEKTSWKNTVILSGVLLGAGMTKFSGLMVVPSIGFLMLCKLIAVPKKLDKTLWGQFVIIGLGAILGFAWGFFLLYFNLPLLPQPLDVEVQSMQAYSLNERLFSFAGWTHPFVDFKGLNQVEPNVWLTLIKTSLFGEWGWQGLAWGYILYACAYIWLVLAFLGFVYLLLKPIESDFSLNGALVILFFAVLMAWINFWLDYPYFCSTEFRYTAIFLPASVLWVGHLLTQKSLPKYVSYCLAGGVCVMILARFMLYLNTI